MQSSASLRFERVAPRKVRVVAKLIRGKRIDDAINTLVFLEKGAAKVLRKVLVSAIANAEDKSKGSVDTDSLIVKDVVVDQGPTVKRSRPRAMGRATPINKRTSHVRVVLEDAAN